MNSCYEYALQNDIVDRIYTQFVEINYTEAMIDRIPYTQNEVEQLWQLVSFAKLLAEINKLKYLRFVLYVFSTSLL